uniref:Uncharacterized protein n=1 Tax=Arundo donax TaxID=35708 RepID=A0A0A9C543_ARUDO
MKISEWMAAEMNSWYGRRGLSVNEFARLSLSVYFPQ